MKDVSNLVAALNTMIANPDITHTVPPEVMDEDGAYSSDDLPEEIQAIERLANEVLISSRGGCDFGNISLLEKAGYRVTCGERDSFGWLSGIIHTKKGTKIGRAHV